MSFAKGDLVNWLPAGARLYRSGKIIGIDDLAGLAYIEHRQTLRNGSSLLRTTPVSISTLQKGRR